MDYPLFFWIKLRYRAKVSFGDAGKMTPYLQILVKIDKVI